VPAGRKAKPTRLYYREGDDQWIIRDRDEYVRTGFRREQTEEAAGALADYLGERRQPAVSRERNSDALLIADVILAYEQIKAPRDYDNLRRAIDAGQVITREQRKKIDRHDELVYRLQNINAFFGARSVADVRRQLCLDYVDWRMHQENDRTATYAVPPARPVAAASARRELEDMRAAINAWHSENTLSIVPVVTLPEKSEGRKRWLTRNEAARLLGAALGFVWDNETSNWKRDEHGHIVRRDRVTRTRRRHAARFVLIGLYSGRREETIRRTLWVQTPSNPSFDLERLVYHGRGADEAVTKKRRPPAKIATRLRPHLLRWRGLDKKLEQQLLAEGGSAVDSRVTFVVHRPDGRPLLYKIKTGWNGMVVDAGLDDDVVRHALRHTAATWLMQRGTDLWQAAGFLGMTVEQLEKGYGHHHPDFQQEAASAFGGAIGRNEPG
jgi:integrase